jgi:hypothetical protein
MMARLEMPKKTTGFYCEDYSMTLPTLPYHPRKVMERHMEIYLEYFRYDGLFVRPSSALLYDHARALYNSDLRGTDYGISDRYALVVESSESATYITPFFEGQPVKAGIKRLDVGGKLLTNYLKEILSFRHLDLKNSDRLIKQIKEDVCFVSQNLMQDMRCKRGTFLKHFVMPDDELKKKGYAVDLIDESTNHSTKPSTLSISPLIKNDSKFQRSYSHLRISAYRRRGLLEQSFRLLSSLMRAHGTITFKTSLLVVATLASLDSALDCTRRSRRTASVGSSPGYMQ